MKFLSAPWRWDFIIQIGKQKGCLFCKALQSDQKSSLICYRGKRYFVILNKYPYSTGHLMIVPNQHISSPHEIAPEESTEMWDLMNKSIRILKKNLHPDGFNIGMNIGQSAGAGIKDHFHLHIVPRWTGDANYMAVIGDTKVLSYKLDEILNILKKEFSQ
ncbi:MAG: HIT domain-containing protein [Candidatus Aminicenantes bacterium]|nr:HIT domain-containing protein [Candidatus Aminicenantes bacterium]